MRAALWLVALFAVAVATALLAGNNQGTVTLFWMPYRVDLSINMVALLWVLSFAFMHLALRALAALFELPKQARRWRLLQKERAVHAALLDGLAQMMTGRYVRARKSAEQALALESSLQSVERHEDPLPRHLPQLRALAELIAAESAHALRDRAAREAHLQNVIALPTTRQLPGLLEAVEAARLSADIAPQWADPCAKLSHTAIATVYLHCTDAGFTGLARPMMALHSNAQEPAQFVFDRGALSGQPGLLAAVVSACQSERDDLTQSVQAQVCKALGLNQVTVVQTVVEKRATLACTAGLNRPESSIADGLWACGDYIQGPYPSTLEGAVRSGVAAVQIVLNS